MMANPIEEIKNFDFSELTVENIGSWPSAIKGLVLVVVFILCLLAGYFFLIAEKKEALTFVENKELELKKTYENRAFKAANLEKYRQQMIEMEQSFEAMLSQLPTDTEVPGLLEDITERGVINGLDIKSIKLQPERKLEYYVELPIAIEVVGSYHDLASFVSGIASLPRIVTLHDFVIKKNGSQLKMNITAKTYRYNDEEA